MVFPAELKYTKEHEWLRIDGDMAYVGITDFAQSELGDLVYVEVDTVGDVVKSGDVFGTVEAVKTTSDLYMPVTGEIIEFNQAISESGGDNPALINTDPYGEGWIVKIKITNPAELSELLDSNAYSALVH